VVASLLTPIERIHASVERDVITLDEPGRAEHARELEHVAVGDVQAASITRPTLYERAFDL
jgi:hypothetical protein